MTPPKMDIAQLMALKEEDSFRYGALLEGLDDGAEQVEWDVLEVLVEPIPSGERHRLTLHGYYFGVFLFIAKVDCRTGGISVWKFT